MLAFLAAKAPSWSMLSWPLAIAPVLAMLFIAVSLGYLYASGAPTLEGGHRSLIYFREIAQRTEAVFLEQSQQMTDEQYLKDLLGQVWRNSEILSKKFDYLQTALLFLGISILPWLVALAEFAILSGGTNALNGNGLLRP
jgi:pycsar effector protein